MKKQLLYMLPFLLLSSLVFYTYIPACKNLNVSQWTNCKGIYFDGTRYAGEYGDGQANGHGAFMFPNGKKYVGKLKDDLPHGLGTYTHLDGRQYVGEYKDGFKYGQGTFTWPDGVRYIGEFKNGQMHGVGKLIYPSGKKYVGEFDDGRMHGQGTLMHPDGTKYVGEYKHAQKHGQGSMTLPNGAKYIGEHKDGKPNGQGTFIWSDGVQYVGEWKDAKKIELADQERQPADEDKQLADKYEQLWDDNRELADKDRVIFTILSFKENFKFERSESEEIDNRNFKLQKFTNSPLKHTGPRAYLESYNGNLFLITGTGSLMYTSIKNIKDKNFILNRIPTNFMDIAGKDYIQLQESVVSDFLIKKDKLYIAYIKQIKDKCFEMSILVSELNLNKMLLEEFFTTNECRPEAVGAEGGKLSDFIGNRILLTIGDHGAYERQKINTPQNTESLMGKIISINEDTKEYKLLSMGHRNPTGLFYDKESNIIFSTEHGPEGGDEINVNISPDDGKIKNYGWAISSYGEHYDFPGPGTPLTDEMQELYKIAPLHKSHKDYGFIEPLKEFTPSIGIAPIIETNELIHMPNKKMIYVGALGYNIEEGDLSIHQIILNPDLTIAEHNIMPIGERVRDIIYVKELNRILLFLESTGSIGILEAIH
ncbi:MAG: PQQ-dependent sugar dehydrogenase [Pseudomonadota bacterium]|nr:PQQ-dependent sugar dehydrogenase [Pseudomonadota bacterium]